MIIGTMYYMTINSKTTVRQKVLQILKNHEDKYGKAPRVVEISHKVINVEKVDLPPEMNIVVRGVHLPNNHLMVGDDEE